MALIGQHIILQKGTTDTVTSQPFVVEKGREVTVCLYPEANLGTDTAELQMVDPDGNGVQATDDNGDIDLSANRTMEVVVAPGTWQLYVPTRTASWGIFITRRS